ncbi:MAG: hypothetical protein AABY22_09040, partial [Nanoarchaeota archaeon]
MKQYFKIILPSILIFFGIVYYVNAAPSGTFYKDIWPLSNNQYNLGTSTLQWLGISVKNASTTVSSATTICLTGDTCRSTWPAGGSGTPGGSDTQVQFNDATAFGGDTAFT